MQRALVLAIAAIVLGGSTGASAADVAPRLVLGYYVPYDATSWSSLQANAAQLDIVAAQWVTVDACGSIGSADDQTLKAFASANAIKVVPSLLTLSPWLNHQLLTEEAARATLIEQIIGYTVGEGYDGFDLDLEGVLAEDREALTGFVVDVANGLHANGKVLTLAIPAKERDVRTGWAGPYDYASLGAAADLVTVMAYEYRGPFSGPGSVAPIDWVDRVAAFARSQMPPEKVLLGLAFYGYDWNVTAGGTRSVGYARAAALAEHYGAEVVFDGGQQSVKFRYTSVAGEQGPPEPRLATPRQHTIRNRALPTCDIVPPTATPTPGIRRPPPAPGTPLEHEVWVEESTSAAARLQIAERYGLGGIATWRLGLEDPGVWPLFATWRTPR